MPNSINIPGNNYSRRHNVELLKPPFTANPLQTKNNHYQGNSITYFDNRKQIPIFANHINSTPVSPYSRSTDIYTSNRENRLHFNKAPVLPSKRLPPLPASPAKYLSHQVQEFHFKDTLKHHKITTDDKFITQKINKISNVSKSEIEYAKEFKGKSEKRKFFIGFVLLTLSFAVFGFYDSMMLSLLRSAMQLKDGGMLTENWKNVPLPVDACFYLLELKNGKQFLKGEKPRVVEQGPFCYYEFKKRTVLEWKDHTVIFTERFSFEFNDKRSASLDASIQVLNLPFLLTVFMIRHMIESSYLSFTGPLVYNLIAKALRATGEELVERRTAREILEGRTIKMVEYSEIMLRPLKALGIPVPAFGVGAYQMHNSSFGYVSQRMWTDFGPYEVFTKTEQGHIFGEILSLENKDTMPVYKYPCNQITGGDGMFFGPNAYQDTLTIFNQHACRVLAFVKNDTITVSGMKVVRYTLDPHIFDMSLSRNRCYCLENRPWQECDGWTDMSPCMGGIPMGLSFPHFYGTPKRLREVDGLFPEATKHFGYLHLEPQLGIPIGARISMQGTIAIKAISSVAEMSKLPTVVLPLFWVHEGATLKGATAVGMSVASNIIRYGSFAFLFGGVGLSAAFFYSGNQIRNQEKRLRDIE